MVSTVANAQKLLDRMTDAEHQSIPPEFFGLFYGDKGTRKSTTAQGLAQKLKGEGQILFVAAGDGFVSLDRFPALKRDTHHIRVDDPRELFVLSKALRARSKGYEDFTVVVLDDFDSWWMDTLHAYAYEKANLDPDKDELPEIDWTWYGPPQQAMMNTIKNFYKTAGLHIILTAHEQGRAIKGESGGPDRYTPLLGTKLSAGIGHLAHVFGRFESRSRRDPATKKQVYTTEVQIQPTRYVEAKSRLSNTDELKLDSVELVKVIANWVHGGGVADSAIKPEAEVVADEPSDNDDEDFEVTDFEG